MDGESVYSVESIDMDVRVTMYRKGRVCVTNEK